MTKMVSLGRIRMTRWKSEECEELASKNSLLSYNLGYSSSFIPTSLSESVHLRGVYGSKSLMEKFA